MHAFKQYMNREQNIGGKYEQINGSEYNRQIKRTESC